MSERARKAMCFVQGSTWPGEDLIASIKSACIQQLAKSGVMFIGGWRQHFYFESLGKVGVYNLANPCCIGDIDFQSPDPVGVLKLLVSGKQLGQFDYKITAGMRPGVFSLHILGGSIHLVDASYVVTDVFEAIPKITVPAKLGTAAFKATIPHPLISICRNGMMLADVYTLGHGDLEKRILRCRQLEETVPMPANKVNDRVLPRGLAVDTTGIMRQLMQYLYEVWLPEVRDDVVLTGLCLKHGTSVSLDALVDYRDFIRCRASLTDKIVKWCETISPKHIVEAELHEACINVVFQYESKFQICLNSRPVVRLFCMKFPSRCVKTKRGRETGYGNQLGFLAQDWVSAIAAGEKKAAEFIALELCEIYTPFKAIEEFLSLGRESVCGHLPARNMFAEYLHHRKKHKMYSYSSEKEETTPVEYHGKGLMIEHTTISGAGLHN